MGNKFFVLTAVALVFAANLLGQGNKYVAPNGDDGNNGSIAAPYGTVQYASRQLTPGDTLFLRQGSYRNIDFGDGNIWKETNVARITSTGAPGQYIVITNYPGEQATIEFDGVYGFLIQNANYLKIEGLTFRGNAQSIDLAEAHAAWGLYKDADGVIHDLAEEMGIDITDHTLEGMTLPKPATPNIKKPDYYNGRGLVANKSHHIEFVGNTFIDIPSAAIRAQQSDYVIIENNVVQNNTYWTTQGVGAITISEATTRPTGDTNNGEKIIIRNNRVHHNENRMISWNPNKLEVKFDIDEGTGIFLTRNNDTYDFGRMRITNNLSYENGASGIVCHFTNRAKIDHNTVYKNGANNTAFPGGIGINTADDVIVENNISYARPDKWALGILAQPVTNLVVQGNIIFNDSGSENVHRNIASGWTEVAPGLVNGPGEDFTLMETSPAINSGTSPGQSIDIDYQPRNDGMPDIGAYEYQLILPVELSAFSVVLTSAKAANLSWSTSLEIDCDFFEVQRSVSGTNRWEVRGSVNSNGLEVNKYDFSDELEAAGTYYYRLRMVDLDGSYTYSTIEHVKVSRESDFLSVFPNPVSDDLFVKTPQAEGGAPALFNASGQKLMTGTLWSSTDRFREYKFSVRGLPAGLYYLGGFPGRVVVKN